MGDLTKILQNAKGMTMTSDGAIAYLTKIEDDEQAIKAYIADVIGEDEKYQTWSKTHKRFIIHREELVDNRNDLRAEQRKRAGI
ncbi:MAG: hypothetical protein ABIR46_03040 [Candidatus Saccharimonadales bacterium]